MTLATLIDTNPITAFNQMAQRVNSLPGRMFVNTAPVDLSLGNIKEGELLGSLTLKMKVHSDSLGQLHDFDGDLGGAVALAKGIKRGVFDTQVRVVYSGAGMPLGIGLSWESFDLSMEHRHVEAGSKIISDKLLAAIFTLMQPNDPLNLNAEAHVDNYSRRSDDYGQPDRNRPTKRGNPAGANNAEAVERAFERLRAERKRFEQPPPQTKQGKKKKR